MTRKKLFILSLLAASLFISCKKESPDPDNNGGLPDHRLSANLEVPSLLSIAGNGHAFHQIVFNEKGNGAALKGYSELYYTEHVNGRNFKLVKTFGADTLVQSVALHPEKDLLFLIAKIYSNHAYSGFYQILFEKNASGNWDNMLVRKTRFKNNQGSGEDFSSDLNCLYSFSYGVTMINLMASENERSGGVFFLNKPDNLNDIYPQERLKTKTDLFPLVPKSIANVGSTTSYFFHLSAHEARPNHPYIINSFIYTMTGQSVLDLNKSDEYQDVLPDYRSAAPSSLYNSVLSVYSGENKIYRTRKLLPPKVQEIVIKGIVGASLDYGNIKCAAEDPYGYLWFGTDKGLFKSWDKIEE